MTLGGTALYRSQDLLKPAPSPGGGGEHFELHVKDKASVSDSAKVSGSGSTTAEGVATAKRRRAVPVGQTLWDVAISGFGFLLGSLHDSAFAVLGAVVAFVWGRWRWNSRD